MKARLLFIMLSSALVYACSPDSLPTYDFSNYRIDRVVCEASSNYLVADNISELDLHVKLYSKMGTYNDIYGIDRDYYMEIPRERWRDHDIKFYINGSRVTPPYKTSATSPATLQCYAEVDGVRSGQSPAKLLALYQPRDSRDAPAGTAPEYTPDPDPFFFEVTVREAYTPAARKIPVVFHIIDTKDNQAKEQELHSSAIYDIIDLLNYVYGRKHSTAPNGANPNIMFVPALKNTSGAKMTEPGINRIYLDGTNTADYSANYLGWIWNLDKTSEGLELNESRYNTMAAAGTLPVRTPRVFWNPDRYLNIWVLATPDLIDILLSSSSLAVTYFPLVYPGGIYDDEAFPIPDGWESALRIMDEAQLAMWKKNPYDLRLPPAKFTNKNKSLGQAGLWMTKRQATNYSIAITQHMGAFLGLIPNASVTYADEHLTLPTNATGAKRWLDDYCDDLPPQNRWYGEPRIGGVENADSGTGIVKYTKSAPYFVYRSFNIMESGSSYSYVSQDQVRRMQWVLENVPGRQMWKDLWAITE